MTIIYASYTVFNYCSLFEKNIMQQMNYYLRIEMFIFTVFAILTVLSESVDFNGQFVLGNSFKFLIIIYR